MLTDLEKFLIQGLKIFGCDELDMLAVMLQLNKPDSQLAMCDWMLEHPDATPMQLSSQARKLAVFDDWDEYKPDTL